MSDPILNELTQIRWMSDLPTSVLRSLAQVARLLTCDDGQMIMAQGEPAPVFWVQQGAARVFAANLDGREQNLIVVRPGETFNMPAAFSEHPVAPATATAVGPTRLIAVEPQDFCRLVVHSPELALTVLRDFAARLYHLSQLTQDLSLRSVRARLARFLLDQAQTPQPGRWTHQEIAARIGTAREVVSRAMRALVQEGLIQIDRHRIIVLRFDQLRIEAEF